jgi:hypothetical protein
MNFFEKENARRVAHVVKFNKAHGREATQDEMNQMFGYTDAQHDELLRAARTNTPANL